MPLPGDELIGSPLLVMTHAVTVNAGPSKVWPWLVQIGQGRAGFYSDSPFWNRCVDWYYRTLSQERGDKDTTGYRVVNDTAVIPEWQDPHVGDIIADGPPGTAYYVVRHVERNRILVLFTDTHLRYLLPARIRDNPRLHIQGKVSDCLFLTEPEPGVTRVVRRSRLSCGPFLFRFFAVPIVVLWGEHITAHNFLRGVKRRAESTSEGSVRIGSAGGDSPAPLPTPQ